VTIGEFVKILKEQNKKSTVLVQKYQMLDRILSLLNKLRDTTEDFIYAKAQSPQGEVDEGSDLDALKELEKEFANVENELVKAAAKCNDYCQRCLSLNIDVKSLEDGSLREPVGIPVTKKQVEQYLSLGEERVMEAIRELQEDITNKKAEISALAVFVSQYERELHDMEMVKPHKFEADLGQLNELHKKTMTLSSRILNEYNSGLNTLTKDKKGAERDSLKDENKRKYYFEVSKYLAQKLGSFKHIDKTYKAKIVDTISGTIITDNEEAIRLSDMGTGQTQSAYILSLLNINAKTDSRKIIALFDEIAMMDDDSLQPICSRMTELSKQGRLLLGILVRMGNRTEVKAIG